MHAYTHAHRRYMYYILPVQLKPHTRNPKAKPVSAVNAKRLGQVLSKIPKEQHTCVEVQGEVIDIKMRIFVSNSEDAKAVMDYIRTHEKQVMTLSVMSHRHVCMRAHMHTCMHAYIAYIHTYIQTNTHTHIHTYIRTYKYTYTVITHKHTHIHAHTHTHTHTHTHRS